MKFSRARTIAYLFLFLVLFILVPYVSFGAFNDVRLTTGTTLTLTVGSASVNLTVTNGTVESITNRDTEMDIVLAAGSSIDLTSSSRYTINYRKNNATANFECGDSSSVLSLSAGSGISETVTIVPTASVCTTGNSGSGGSSPSSSTTSTTSTTSSATPSTTTTAATTVTPTTTVAAPAPKTTVAPVQPSAPVVSAPTLIMPTRVITKELNPGTRSNEVMDLQKLLAKDPSIYPEGTVSGLYGPKTTAAVKKFQAKYGLSPVGRVGPATIAKINEVLGSKPAEAVPPPIQNQTQQQIESQIKSIQQQIQALTAGAPVTAPAAVSAVRVDTVLNPGTRSDEVKDLQRLLAKDPSIYPEGTVSGLYGPKTTAAVKKFQAKYGLSPVGRVGSATMEKINEVLGGVAAPVVPSVPVAPSAPTTAAQPAPSAPATKSTEDLTKQIEAQIKAIQDQIKALQK